jgi:hypothetical protein
MRRPLTRLTGLVAIAAVIVGGVVFVVANLGNRGGQVQGQNIQIAGFDCKTPELGFEIGVNSFEFKFEYPAGWQFNQEEYGFSAYDPSELYHLNVIVNNTYLGTLPEFTQQQLRAAKYRSDDLVHTETLTKTFPGLYYHWRSESGTNSFLFTTISTGSTNYAILVKDSSGCGNSAEIFKSILDRAVFGNEYEAAAPLTAAQASSRGVSGKRVEECREQIKDQLENGRTVLVAWNSELNPFSVAKTIVAGNPSFDFARVEKRNKLIRLDYNGGSMLTDTCNLLRHGYVNSVTISELSL